MRRGKHVYIASQGQGAFKEEKEIIVSVQSFVQSPVPDYSYYK